MTIVEVMVLNPSGIHARPAMELSDLCKKFSSEIKFYYNGKTINPNSPLSILAGCIEPNSSMKIAADGVDEQECIEQLEAYIKDLKE